MEKSFSQRVARFLEIICYFLLIPTSLIEIIAIFYGIMFLVNGDFGAFIFCLVITAIYCSGNLLLYGYYKHSRGKLGNSASFWLWVGTITFNFIPFAYMILIWMNDLNLRNGE